MATNIKRHISHIKSSQTETVTEYGLQVTKPKLPLNSQIVDGEIAINYAHGNERISIRNNDSTPQVVSFLNENVTYDNEEVVASAFVSIDNRVADLDNRVEDLDNRVEDYEENKEKFLTHMTNVTYSELVTLKNNSQLTPGMWYRITDYATTTTQPNTRSAGHPFDIIVLATETNKLNENAKAARRSDDTYFQGQNLDAWEIKYCVGNNNALYHWADTTNGKGVIYSMKDEHNNICGYDFKNIQFARKFVDNIQWDAFGFTDTTIFHKTDTDDLIKTGDANGYECFGETFNLGDGISIPLNNQWLETTNNELFYYTFSVVNGDTQTDIVDASLISPIGIGAAYNNTIKPVEMGFGGVSVAYKSSYVLPDNIITNQSEKANNYIEQSTGNTIKGSNNICKQSANNVIIGDYNTCDTSMGNIICGSYNKVGKDCKNLLLSKGCDYNTVEEGCSWIVLDKSIRYTTIKKNNVNIALGDGQQLIFTDDEYIKNIVVATGTHSDATVGSVMAINVTDGMSDLTETTCITYQNRTSRVVDLPV